jgi:hypothetical protein
MSNQRVFEQIIAKMDNIEKSLVEMDKILTYNYFFSVIVIPACILFT